MKRRTNKRPPQGFDVKPFLRQIEKVMPTVESELIRQAIAASRDFLLHHASELGRPNQAPALLGMLCIVLENLRCCGVVPEGWPAAPPPTEQLRFVIAPVVDIRGQEGAR